MEAIEAVGDADRDADRPRLRDDLPEDADPDRALREPCGDGVRRRLRELRPDEAEPERPESVRRRRRVGVRGGVDMGSGCFWSLPRRFPRGKLVGPRLRVR